MDKVYIYRSPVSSATPRASWVWHYDNHPREVLKVMIYLTDVTEGAAPFEYLRETRTSRPVLGAPIAPLHRVPAVPTTAQFSPVRGRGGKPTSPSSTELGVIL